MPLGARCAAVGIALLLGAAASRPARVAAQDDSQRTALARTLFQEGLARVEQQDWAGAADRFQRAYALRASPQLRLNLALALVELHRYVEASEHLRAVESDRAAPEPVRTRARESLAEVTPRLGRLTVQVSGDREATTFTLDDHPLLDAAIGVATPVDPGAHVVAALRGGETVASESVEVAGGANAEVTLALPLPRVAEPPPPPPPPPPAHAEGGSVFATWWFWALVFGAVTVGATVAIIAGTTGGGQAPAVYGNTNPPLFDVMVMP